MVISELISKLEKLKKKHGDLVVTTNDDGDVFDVHEVWVNETFELSGRGRGDYYDNAHGKLSRKERDGVENVVSTVFISPFYRHRC